MPRLKNIKPPTQKRVEGAIYSFEKREEHNKAVALVEKCKRQCKKIKVIWFDRFGVKQEKYVIPAKH